MKSTLRPPPASTAPALLLVTLLLPAAAAQERPWPRPVVASEALARITFADGAAGWQALHAVSLRAEGGRLLAEATGFDPYLVSPPLDLSGNLRVVVRGEFAIEGPFSCYWSTAAAPAMAEARAVHARAPAGAGAVELRLGEVEQLRQLRFDPGGDVGRAAIDSIEVIDDRLAERWITGVRLQPEGRLRVEVAGGAGIELPAGFVDGFAEVELATAPGLPSPRPAVHLHDRAALAATGGGPGLKLRVHPAASAAAVYSDGELVAVVHPLVMRDGHAVPLAGSREWEDRWQLTGEGVQLTITPLGTGLAFAIDADEPVEGPVVRSAGPHVRAMLAGLEFLSRGEPSSSDADIETAARFRYAPDPLQLTWPCCAVQTATTTIALTWEDPTLQPVFAAPDCYDGLDGARFALRGARIRATLDCGARDLDDAMLRALRRLPLPAPLPAPADEAWRAQCRAAFAGPLGGEGGWGHCAEPNWGRQPFADLVSTIWRLDGALPDLVRTGGAALVPGGAHLRDDAAWFVAGQAQRWAAQQREHARATAAAQRADGTWAYAGRYRRGHFEDTASGNCGAAAATLLGFARLSGDADALAAGLRALSACERFTTPRGAQTWELSLHTPDILAAAHLVNAHVLACELTRDPEWLTGARRWAVRGLPFVYLRGEPAMPYATIAVFGATNWRAPLWIGLPVQWCGLVYADALLRLAPYDDALPWRTLGEGILRAGQHMQAQDGPLIGCLPDSWDLRTKRGNGPWINPAAMLALDARLRGEPVDLWGLTTNDGRRAVSAWPIEEVDGRLRARAARDVVPVVLDGSTVIEVPGGR